MGLNCTHDAFDGSYSTFHDLRQVICFCAGGSYPPHYKYTENLTFAGVDIECLPLKLDDLEEYCIYLGTDMVERPAILELLFHSDCEGSMSPELCEKLADELEALLPKIKAIDDRGLGHFIKRGGYSGMVQTFIKGCRAAASEGESLWFC